MFKKILILIIIFYNIELYSKTYYIDSLIGSDTFTGLNKDNPFKTWNNVLKKMGQNDIVIWARQDTPSLSAALYILDLQDDKETLEIIKDRFSWKKRIIYDEIFSPNANLKIRTDYEYEIISDTLTKYRIRTKNIEKFILKIK